MENFITKLINFGLMISTIYLVLSAGETENPSLYAAFAVISAVSLVIRIQIGGNHDK